MQWAVLRLDIDAAWNEGEVMRGGGARGGQQGEKEGESGLVERRERRVDVAQRVSETLSGRQGGEEHTGRWTHTKHTTQSTALSTLAVHRRTGYTPLVGV